MFAIWCPTHESRVLLSWSRIADIRNRDGVIEVDLRCWCGDMVTHVTGREATVTAAA